MSIFSLLGATQKEPERKPLGSGSGPLGLKTNLDTEIDFLEKTQLITPKEAKRRREDAALKSSLAPAKTKRTRKAGLEQSRRAEDLGTPVVSKSQVRKSQEGTWEYSVESGRKSLRIVPGSEDDALLKSALWVFSLDEEGTGTNRLSNDDYKDVVAKMSTPEGRQHLQMVVDSYREAVKKWEALPKREIDVTPEQAIKDRATELALRESGAMGMIESVQDVTKKVSESAPMQAVGELAKFGYNTTPYGALADSVFNLGGGDVVAGVAKDVASSTITGPARIFSNLFKFITPGEVEGKQRMYAAGEMALDLMDVIGLGAIGATDEIAQAVRAAMKSDEAVTAIAGVIGDVKQAETILEDVVKSVDELPEEDLVKIFQERLNVDTPNPDVPGAIDVNVLKSADKPNAWDTPKADARKASGADEVSTAVDEAMPPKAQEPGASPGGSTTPEIDAPILKSLADKARERKAARQARRDAGEINLVSGFDPEIIYEAVDDAIIYMAEKGGTIEAAIRSAMKANGLGDDAYDAIKKGLDEEVQDATGGFEIRNQYTNDIRKKYGLESSKSEYVPNNETIIKAQELAGSEGDIVAKYLAPGRKQPPTPEEQVAVGIRLNDLHREAEDLAIQIEKGIDSGADVSQLSLKYKGLTESIDLYSQALKSMGGEAGRALGIRARAFKYENGNLRAEFVARTGRAPTAEESVQITKLTKERDDALAELANLRKSGAKRAAQTAITRPRKIRQALSQAEDDLAKWRKRVAVKGGKTRGAVIAPDELLVGAVLIAKVGILRGLRTVDEIFALIRKEGIDLDDETLADAVLMADAESRIPRPKSVKPTINDLRKELKAIKSKDVDVIQELLDEADRLASTRLDKLDPAEYSKFVEDASKVVNRLAPGKSFDWQRLVYGKNAIDDPRIAQARGRARIASEKARELAQEAERLDLRASEGKAVSSAKSLGNALMSSRQIITGPDVSFGFRQGWASLFSNPKAFGRMTKTNIESFFSGKASEAIEINIAGHERLDDALNAGLDVAIGTGTFEEDLAKILNNVPGYKQSQRAYQNSANQIRLELYDYLTHPNMAQGDKTAMAEFINAMTGRSKIVAGDTGVAKLINSVLFAPRYLVSRLRYVTPYDLAKAVKNKNYEAAKLIAREQAKFYGGMTSFLALLKMGESAGGYTVDTNPTSSNFGQVKTDGGLTIDATGGFSGYVKPIFATLNGTARAAVLGVAPKDQRKQIAKDWPSAMTAKGDPMNDAYMTWAWFVRGRMSPAAQAFDAIQRTGTSGNIKSFDRPAEPWEIAARAYVPIHVQNLLEGYAQDQSPAEITSAFLMEFLGIGTRHDTKEKFDNTLPEDVIKKASGG